MFRRSINFLLLAALAITGVCEAQNPFITHMYTADPSARVFNDTLFIYPSHDPDTATWFSMVDWHVFSTVDMKTWAPDCEYYQGKYYLSYSGRNQILYAMADNPYGPFEYKGVILDEVNSGTNHHSIVEYKGHWYLFYHNSDLYFKHHPEVEPVLDWDKVNPYRRSICVDYLYYNPDGTIKEVIPTKEGVKAITGKE